MDHVLDAILPHYEAALEWFIEEQEKGGYEKLSDNPYYEEIKALIDAMNVLRGYLRWTAISLPEAAKRGLEGATGT